MAHDPDPDDERPGSDPPLPPEDRLWRHPSELGAGIAPPKAWFADPSPTPSRRSLGVGALAGACLAGAVVAVGAMWLAGPTRSSSPKGTPATAVAVRSTVASFGPSPVPTEELARTLGPALPLVEVQRGQSWTSGTGVWLDDDGALLTAAPLVAGAAQVIVTGRDGVGLVATVAGTDTATGIATLVVARTSGTPTTAATTEPRAGEPIAIVGAPDLLAGGDDSEATVVTAVVRTASTRTAIGDLLLHDAIQLDRKVPADALGGLLVDARGRLVGVAVGSAGDPALGAATPARAALEAAEALRDHGEVDRAWLGVQATDLEPDRSTLLRLPGGARVTEVTPESPAARAGLAVDDVVTAIDDTVIDDASDLVNALRTMAPGHEASIEVARGAEVVTLSVTLG